MKKIFLFFVVFLIIPTCCLANERQRVKLKSCVDGDTANFVLNNKTIKVRFLAIDSPELVHENKKGEPYGNEAKNFTCSKLKKANKIELEYDKNSSKKDKYGRLLKWVFIDDILLQKEIVENGYAKVTYLYDDYKYTDILFKAQNDAKAYKKGIYSNKKYSEDKNVFDNILTILKRLKNDIINFFEKIFK